MSISGSFLHIDHRLLLQRVMRCINNNFVVILFITQRTCHTPISLLLLQRVKRLFEGSTNISQRYKLSSFASIVMVPHQNILVILTFLLI